MSDTFWGDGFLQIEATKPKNPCVRLYGKGPDGMRCKSCLHLYVHAHGRSYYKCEFRVFTHGPATDHRVNYPACRRWEGTNGS